MSLRRVPMRAVAPLPGRAVLGIEGNGVVDPHPRPERELRQGERVLFVGTASQRDEFERVFK